MNCKKSTKKDKKHQNLQVPKNGQKFKKVAKH